MGALKSNLFFYFSTMQIKTYSPTDHKIKALIYWESWSWKTSFGATAPGVIFASAEAWLLSVWNKKIDYVEIKTKQDLLELYQYLAKGGHGYKTVVIDSITEINDIIKQTLEQKRGRALQIQDWGEISKDIEKILRSFRGLDMHVIFIAQEKVEKDEDKIVKIAPSLNGSAATKIAYFMDVVWHISVNAAGEHLINTQPSPKYVTKDRTGLIGNGIKADFSIWIEATAALAIKAEDIVYDSLEIVPEDEPTPEVDPVPETPKVEPIPATPKAPVVPPKVEEPKEEKPAAPAMPSVPKEDKKETPKSEDEPTPALAKPKASSDKQHDLINDLYNQYVDKKGELATPLANILKAYKVGGKCCEKVEDLSSSLASDLIKKLQGALK